MHQKKTIYLRGAYNLYNFGDDLLLISIIELLTKGIGFTNESFNIYISKNFESLSQLKFNSELELKQSVEWSDLIYRINLKLEQLCLPLKFPLSIHELWGDVFRGTELKQPRLLSLLQSIVLAVVIAIDLLVYKMFRKALFVKEYVYFLQNIDVIHYIGGGYLNERWLEIIIYEYITITLAKKLKPNLKVIGTGLGLGPFKSRLSLIVFKLFAKKFDCLFVREVESLSILDRLKIDVYKKVLGDDVILLLPELKQLKNKCESNLHVLTALNLKSFPDYNYYLIKEILENYLKKSLESGKHQVEYFCFGREPGPGDRSLIEILDRRYQNQLVVHDPYEEGWNSFLENLKQADVGVGCAYHFNIISTLLSIPTIGIYSGEYYQQKIVGVMKLLSHHPIVLSLNELTAKKDLTGIIDLAINSHNSSIESSLEQMHEVMRQEYSIAYKSILK